jgi:tungstate transport system ATP-binding protein
MNSNPIISFCGINKSFSSVPLINNVDIDLFSGQAIILTGDNGTGKTTLLRILAGLEKPDNGMVKLGLAEIPWHRAKAGLIKKVMYLHQHPYMFSGSVHRNLSLAVPKLLTSLQTRQQVTRALQWGMLSKHEFSIAKKLSGGQQQRIALARAWLRQSPVLLLDEPTANMDNQSIARTMKLLHQLKENGISLLICSHNHQIFESLCDRHLSLANNRLQKIDEVEYKGNITSINQERINENATG